MVGSAEQPGFRRRRAALRGGFTLIEMVMSLAVVSILASALGSVVVLASRAMPTSSTSGAAMLAAGVGLSQLSSELRYATSISEATATAITFKVADRSGDGQEETIRYAWGGANQALTRTYNGGTAAAITPALQSFSLAYTRETTSTTQNTTAIWDSGEVQLAGFTTFATGTVSANSATIGTATWAAEAFTIDRVSLPSDTTKLSITRVSLKMRKPSTGTAGATVAIHIPSASGSSIPATSPIGTPYAMPATALTTTTAWVDSTFTDVSFNNANTTSFVIVVKGIAAPSAYVQYLSTTTATADTNVYRATTNSGGSWTPTSNQQLYDAPFAVYGSYQRQVNTTVNIDSHTLRTATVSVQVGTASGDRLETGIETANDPSIPGP